MVKRNLPIAMLLGGLSVNLNHLKNHVGPEEHIVFIDNISLYFNCLGSVQDVFKWSCYSHMTLF